MRVPFILAPVLLITACATPTVTETKYIEVKVPVSAPCVDEERKPDSEVIALNEKITQEEFDTLTTDQRQALLMSQGFARKAYGEELTVATAGCP